MRISDWSSDVCSSDLTRRRRLAPGRRAHDRGRARIGSRRGPHLARTEPHLARRRVGRRTIRGPGPGIEIGRAACRGGGGQYGEISVGAVSLTKKKKKETHESRLSRETNKQNKR